MAPLGNNTLRQLVFPRPDSKLPGPRGLPFLGVGHLMMQNSIQLITSLWQRYGDTVAVPLPGISGVQTCDPELIQRCLLQTERQFSKGKIYQRLSLLFGDGLVTSQGEIWKAHRRYMDPLFTQRSVMLYMNLIDQKSRKLVQKWQAASNQMVDVSLDAMDLTFEVLIEAIFSKDLGADTAEIRADLEVMHDYSKYLMYSLWIPPLWVPTRKNIRLRSSMRRLEKAVAHAIWERQSTDWQSKTHDLISLLLALKNEAGERALDDHQIRDHLLTMYIAGHDTTAHTLSFALYLLAKHPEILKKLRESIKSILKENELSFKELKEMDYLDKVIHETMRLYPTAWSINRISHEDIRYKEYFFPKGTTFFLPQYLVHRHPDYWLKPEEFRPEHFDHEEVANRHKFAFFPFGGGPRNCIGYHLAMMELKVALVHIVLNFDFDPNDIPAMDVDARITMGPKPLLKLRPIFCGK